MRQSTELVFMILGCAALVVAAVLLPVLLLAPATKDDQVATLPAPVPLAEAARPPVSEAPGQPPVSQPSEDASMPAPSEPAVQADQAAAPKPDDPKDEPKPNEQASAPSAAAPVENAKPPEAIAPSDLVAAPGPGAQKDAHEPNRQMPSVVPSAPSEASAPPEPSKSPETEKPAETAASSGPEAPKVVAKVEDAPAPVPAPSKPAQIRVPSWCTNPRGDDEMAVCGNRELLALDAELNTLYSKLMARDQNTELRNLQRRWLAERQTCASDVSCLKQHYEKRIGELARM